LNIKDDKAKTLERTIELKDDEIKKLTISAIDKNTIIEKDDKIFELEKELELLNEELEKADEDIGNLELENEKFRNNIASSNDVKIVDFTNTSITRTEILEKIREILPNALANVMLVVPSIEDLQELYLYDVKSSVSMNIACSIDPGNENHSELLEEIESLDNIKLRNYQRGDRYVLTRDGEELLFGAVGKSENNNLVFHTKDREHIKILNDLAQRGWLQSRRL
jgi:sugar-specific transcriptional regulator TrmB